MKFEIDSLSLIKSLKIVGKNITTKVLYPLVGCVLITADKNNKTVLFTAFDMAINVEVKCSEAEIIESGKVIISFSRFFNLSTLIHNKGLTKIMLELDRDKEKKTVNITTDTTTIKLPFLAESSDYPERPVINKPTHKFIYSKEDGFDSALNSVLFASSTDITKQILTGINLSFQEDGVKLAATDGHRLAIAKFAKPSTSPLSLTLARKLIQIIVETIADVQAEEIEFLYDQNEDIVQVKLKNVTLTSRKLDGQYPPYHRLLPDNLESFLVVDRLQLVKAVGLISLLCETTLIVASFEEGNLSLQSASSVDSKNSHKAVQSINCELQGTPQKIGINYKYLSQSLSVLTSEKVKISYGRSNQPVLLNPVSSDDTTHLLMPVQLRN